MLLFKGLKHMPSVSSTNREVIAVQVMRRKLLGYRSVGIHVLRNGEDEWVVRVLSVMPISLKQT